MKTWIPVMIWTCLPGMIFPAGRLQPSDISYIGAFRLPDSEPFEHGWYWGGSAAACWPLGDPHGPDDGFPGSIFGTGHNWNVFVAEIDIPVPVISQAKNPDDLNTARFLQFFHDVRGRLFEDAAGQPLFNEILRTGMAVLPSGESRVSPKLVMARGQHLQEDRQDPSHMWCELNLSDPRPRGNWFFGSRSNYTTCDYMFEIPDLWSDTHAPGMRLATGRFRDGLWSGMGPALFALRPWPDDTPADGDTITEILPLLLYGIQQPGNQHIQTDPSMRMDGFKEADEWVGGAWIETEEASAVVLAGTRGLGEVWYGLPDGTVWPDEPPYPRDPDNERGWWCETFQAQLIFFDTQDLADVARGIAETWDPQPYAAFDLMPFLYRVFSSQQKEQVSAVCHDPVNNRLYVFEPLADEDKPLVHVFRIQKETSVREPEKSVLPGLILFPNPFNMETTVQLTLEQAGPVHLRIYDMRGRAVWSEIYPDRAPGRNQISIQADNLPSGVYMIEAGTGFSRHTAKMVVFK